LVAGFSPPNSSSDWLVLSRLRIAAQPPRDCAVPFAEQAPSV